MTTKQRIKFLVAEVARFTASHFNLVDPDDVTDDHIEFAYEILWSNDKLGVELCTNHEKVRRAICEAIEEFNLLYAESYESVEIINPKEVAA